MPAQEPPPPAATATTGDGTDNGTESTAPLNQAIRIFARIRPRKANANIRDTSTSGGATKVVVDGPIPGDDNAPQLHFHVPRDETLGLINNSREHFGFRFDRVFDDRTTQEEVFDHVAKDIILSVLDGFNATVFAYGQTGSGKTFTITGGAERYADRGLIPRTVQFIFKEVAQRTKRRYSIGISYLEIYNENGYDLLDDTRDAKRLEDLPKVTLRESEDQTIQLQNLGCHPAASEEEALNWLFTGDTNKMIAETPSNPASSRSHCLFIISIESREEGSEVIRRSKLHLVDLAGSERVSKTGIDGMLLKEAKSINLSLHFLEHVIVALHEKAMGRRTHVPYRNSMMTSILRDSLGGNCKTCMVATLATEEHLLEVFYVLLSCINLCSRRKKK
ncbi:P-loop containing nucleoside triphosphate hydrolase protein [Blastocladiella britannica]|nr:P-loop containing nucleoside triphosphate hydrolase protein [Blastocladiella britannica]